MALTLNSFVSGGSANVEVASITTAAFTPGSNRKLYIAVFEEAGGSGTDITHTSNTGGLTFTRIYNSAEYFNASSGYERFALFEAPVGTSPGSMTVTFDTAIFAQTSTSVYGVFEIVGSTGQAALRSGQAVENSGLGNGSGASGTLPTAALTGNLTIIFAGRNNDGSALASSPAAGGFNATAVFDTGLTQYASICAFQSSTFTGTSTGLPNLGSTISEWITLLVEFEEISNTPQTGYRLIQTGSPNKRLTQNGNTRVLQGGGPPSTARVTDKLVRPRGGIINSRYY